jgi:hypothetical protein
MLTAAALSYTTERTIVYLDELHGSAGLAHAGLDHCTGWAQRAEVEPVAATCLLDEGSHVEGSEDGVPGASKVVADGEDEAVVDPEALGEERTACGLDVVDVHVAEQLASHTLAGGTGHVVALDRHYGLTVWVEGSTSLVTACPRHGSMGSLEQ